MVPKIPRAALCVAVALVLALAGIATACGSGEEPITSISVTTTGTLPTTTSTSAATSTSTTAPATSSSTTESSTTTTTEALSSAETRLPNGNIRAMGFIDKVWEEDGARYLSIDYAEMLTGEEAKAAAIEAGEIGPDEDLPNDYFIRNTNPQTREFRVSDSVAITTATLGGAMDEPGTWAEFLSFWSDSPPEGGEHLHMVPWWIERDGAVVISIAEQYLP
jgi:hypothetical protein